MTRRRWIADEYTQNTATLRGQQAEHLARVLRARVGQQFEIVAGDRVRRGIIERIGPDAVEFSLHENLQVQDALPVNIGLSIVRFERMEWAIEKLTELGVARIVPLRAARSEKHLVQAAEKRVERWRRIAHESAQQSRRNDVPEIADPMGVAEFQKLACDGARILLSERERTRSLRTWLEAEDFASAVSNVLAAIGPEGGWTDNEIVSFAQNEWESVSLGHQILRTETAAIALASVLNIWNRR